MRRAVIGMLVLAMAAPSAAQAAGGPVGAMAGLGVQRPGDPSAYVALPSGGRTILQQLEGSRILRYRTLPGDYGIPGAAYDGSATGLSADGRTLVLAQFAASWNRTRLLPVDTHRYLRPLRPIVLAGFYTVDAISPDGSRLYLIHYRRPQRSVVDYEVRAYDLRARRLLPGAIVDPREPDEKMTGMPMTRVTGAQGRWVYTLYDAKEPFVHALDTVSGTARCIDLSATALRNAFDAKLALDGSTLRIGTVAAVDLRSLVVSYGPARGATPVRAAAAATPATAAPAPASGAQPTRVAAVTAVGLALAATAAFVLRRLRRSRRTGLALDGD